MLHIIVPHVTNESSASATYQCRKCRMLVPQVPHVSAASATVPHLRNKVGSNSTHILKISDENIEKLKGGP